MKRYKIVACEDLPAEFKDASEISDVEIAVTDMDGNVLSTLPFEAMFAGARVIVVESGDEKYLIVIEEGRRIWLFEALALEEKRESVLAKVYI
jgi:hypothetical protein